MVIHPGPGLIRVSSGRNRSYELPTHFPVDFETSKPRPQLGRFYVRVIAGTMASETTRLLQ
jgi:hypothetical protein